MEEVSISATFLTNSFIFITVFAGYRVYCYFDISGSGKLVTLFNSLIFVTALVRSAWFLIPNTDYETTFTFEPLYAYSSPGWKNFVLSEVLLLSGSISLYSVFILIACYWGHLLKKVDAVPFGRQEMNSNRSHTSCWGTLEIFYGLMGCLIAISAVNMTLFFMRVFDSEQTVIFDSIMLAIVSVLVLLAITVFSQRLRNLLTAVGSLNSIATTGPQVRRILAITVACNVFFICRVVIECSLAIYLVHLMRTHRSFSTALSEEYWSWYLFIRYSSEVFILLLELLISTSMKAYSNPRSAGRAIQYSMDELSPLKGPAGISDAGITRAVIVQTGTISVV